VARVAVGAAVAGVFGTATLKSPVTAVQAILGIVDLSGSVSEYGRASEQERNQPRQWHALALSATATALNQTNQFFWPSRLARISDSAVSEFKCQGVIRRSPIAIRQTTSFRLAVSRRASFAKLLYRSQRVFHDRDQSCGRPSLWNAIQRALESSEYLLAMASTHGRLKQSRSRVVAVNRSRRRSGASTEGIFGIR
jgi:hypothetical protein